MYKWKTLRGCWRIAAAIAALLAGSGVASAQHPLPGPWQHADVGNVGLAGSASISSDGDLRIEGPGSDIWGTADSFHFAYRPIEDGQIGSEYPSQDATNPFAKVGL